MKANLKLVMPVVFSAALVFCALRASAAPLTTAQKIALQRSLRDVTTMRVLVDVVDDKGHVQGKVAEVIATAPKTGQLPDAHIIVVGKVGQDMHLSMEEVARLVKLQDKRAAEVQLEISFDDKYAQKDGNSAGAAFTVLILSALKHFELGGDAALAGDINVDGKIGAVSGLRGKIVDAAAKGVRITGIPDANGVQLADALLLEGPHLLWDTQIVSMKSLDDAIALTRKDRDGRIEAAFKQFEDVRTKMADHPIADLTGNVAAKKTLSAVLEAVPGHMSARLLLDLAAGKGPKQLSLGGSLEAAVLSLGHMRIAVASKYTVDDGQYATADAIDATRKAVTDLRKIADPKVEDVLKAIEAYCDACGNKLDAAGKKQGHLIVQAAKECDEKRAALRAAILKMVDNEEAMNRLMRS